MNVIQCNVNKQGVDVIWCNIYKQGVDVMVM